MQISDISNYLRSAVCFMMGIGSARDPRKDEDSCSIAGVIELSLLSLFLYILFYTFDYYVGLTTFVVVIVPEK